MGKSKYYRQIKVPLSVVDRERVALAKDWATKNKRSIQAWPGFNFIKKYFK